MTTLIKRNGFTFSSVVNDLFDTNDLNFGGDFFNWPVSKSMPSVNVTENPKEYRI